MPSLRPRDPAKAQPRRGRDKRSEVRKQAQPSDGLQVEPGLIRHLPTPIFSPRANRSSFEARAWAGRRQASENARGGGSGRGGRTCRDEDEAVAGPSVDSRPGVADAANDQPHDTAFIEKLLTELAAA